MKRPRVLLADDHKLLLEAFQKLLEPFCDVVGTVTDGYALLAAAPALKPDVIVIDIAMPRLNGLDAAKRLKQKMPGAKLVFLTMNPDPELARQAFQAGASGYLLKSSAASELHKAIRAAVRGGTYVTPLIMEANKYAPLGSWKPRRKSHGLTLRQREVLQLLAEGHTMKQVACFLKVAPRTVAYHKYRIMEEFHMKTTADLIRFAIKNRLVSR